MSVVELDDLRAVLREREPLAPDPEEILAGADRRFRRVRARRRVVGAAAAVVFITAGLSVGLGLARQHGSAPALLVPAAAAPSDTVVVPSSSLPFTLDGKASDAKLVSWEISDHAASADYVWFGQTITIVVSDTDPEGGQDSPAVRPYEVNGVKATLRLLPDSTMQRLSWPFVPGKWAAVYVDKKSESVAEMAIFAKFVRAAPTAVPARIRSLRVPAGLSVAGTRGSGSQETVLLCPGGSAEAAGTAATGRPVDCVVVTADKGLTDARQPTGIHPSPAAQRDEVVDGLTLRVYGDGRAVLRQFTDQWLLVERVTGEVSVLPSIATSVIMN